MSSTAGPSQPTSIDVDAIINQLLDVRGSRPGKHVNLLEADIRGLCTNAREIFMSQPVLLEVEAPIKICGARASLFLPLARACRRRRTALIAAYPGRRAKSAAATATAAVSALVVEGRVRAAA